MAIVHVYVPWYVHVYQVRTNGTYTCTYVRTIYIHTYHGTRVRTCVPYVHSVRTYHLVRTRTRVRARVLIMLCHNVHVYVLNIAIWSIWHTGITIWAILLTKSVSCNVQAMSCARCRWRQRHAIDNMAIAWP